MSPFSLERLSLEFIKWVCVMIATGILVVSYEEIHRIIVLIFVFLDMYLSLNTTATLFREMGDPVLFKK